MSAQPLETELAYFEEHRKDFLRTAEGKYVLIKQQEDHGFYDTPENAYKAGIELFGLEPFLIKQVLLEDQIHEIPAHYLGLTHARI